MSQATSISLSHRVTIFLNSFHISLLLNKPFPEVCSLDLGFSFEWWYQFTHSWVVAAIKQAYCIFPKSSFYLKPMRWISKKQKKEMKRKKEKRVCPLIYMDFCILFSQRKGLSTLYQPLLLCPLEAPFSLFYLKILLNYSAYILHTSFFPLVSWVFPCYGASRRKQILKVTL